MTPTFHPLTVRAVRPDTPEAMIVSFDVPAELRSAFSFAAGQYLTLRHPVQGQDLRRPYSICAGVDDGELRVGVRKVPGGVFSNWVHASLRAGDTIDVMVPQGRFTVPLDAAAQRHHLGIAGGSGITPILSILKTVLVREPASRFTLLYANRRQASTMFKDELEDLKDRFMARLVIHHVFSAEPVDTPLHGGRLDRERLGLFLRTLVPAESVDLAYVCGPHAMNDEAEAALLEAGVPAGRVRVERFGVANATAVTRSERKTEVPVKAVVTLVRDGARRDIPFQAGQASVLECASTAGLDLPFSCTSGVCGTCRARVVEGEADMARNFALDRAEVAAGFVLTCQARPTTDRLVLSFDER